jgi:hypothetical protein
VSKALIYGVDTTYHEYPTYPSYGIGSLLA